MPATTTPTFSTSEIVYTFTFSAGSASGLTFDNASGGGVQALQAYVQQVEQDVLADPTIQGQIGDDWQPVWGPVAFADDTSGATVRADNTMGCYYSPSQNLFVIAIAGTNFTSTFDWLDEDLAVLSQVPWTSVGGTGTGNLSAGSAAGLQILLAMTDATPRTMLAALAAFIAKQAVTGATIAVTGHSLAGALSPLLGLYLANNQATLGLTGQAIAVYASAGPTPGDADFAATYETAIAGNALTYTSVFNPFDVVPLAWQVSDLATIPSLYDAHIKPAATDSPPDCFMGSLIAGVVMALSEKSVSYTQVATNRTALSGASFSVLVDAGVSLVMDGLQASLPSGLATYFASITNVARFLAQAVDQHTNSYPALVGIASFDTAYQKILAADKPATATAIDPTRAAIRRVTGVDLGAAPRAAAARQRAA